MHTRSIESVFRTKPAIEGAGVHLMRGFGYHELPRFDPFLLFDDFSSMNRADYEAGFPQHPHRGIETVTYLRAGTISHRDSIGSIGTIDAGEVQWMTAGSGIVHEEIPGSVAGIEGFQLWINLPQSEKMTPPRYRDIRATMIPEHTDDAGVIRVIAGTSHALTGPVVGTHVHPLYLDCTLRPHQERIISIPEAQTCFVYVTHGSVTIMEQVYAPGALILFHRNGDTVALRTGETGAQFLCIAGTPLNEPIAWHGPIVMNTDEEIREALADLRDGTFIKR